MGILGDVPYGVKSCSRGLRESEVQCGVFSCNFEGEDLARDGVIFALKS